MKRSNATHITDASLLFCVVQTGKAEGVLKAARDLGVGAGISYRARGIGLRERLGLLGVAVEAEKEVVELLVPDERVDAIIEGLYRAADMDTLEGGFIFATSVDKAVTYIPDEVLQQLTTDN